MPRYTGMFACKEYLSKRYSLHANIENTMFFSSTITVFSFIVSLLPPAVKAGRQAVLPYQNVLEWA